MRCAYPPYVIDFVVHLERIRLEAAKAWFDTYRPPWYKAGPIPNPNGPPMLPSLPSASRFLSLTLVLALGASLGGCKTLSETRQSDALSHTLMGYQAAVRWSDYSAALSYHKIDFGEDETESPGGEAEPAAADGEREPMAGPAPGQVTRQAPPEQTPGQDEEADREPLPAWALKPNPAAAAVPPPIPLPEDFEDLRVMGYDIIYPPVMSSKTTAQQMVEISYVDVNYQVLHKVKDRQTWLYDKKSKTWAITSPFPLPSSAPVE